MPTPENIGEELSRIEVQDRSPDAIPIEVKRGVGHRIVEKLSGLKIDNATLHEAGVIRVNEAQKAAAIAREQPADLAAAGPAIAGEPISPVQKERALHLVKNDAENHGRLH